MLHPAPVHSLRPTTRTPEPTATDRHLAHRVLVVDDDPDMRDLYVELLAADGNAVAHAADGHAALRLLQAGFDACVVLSDVRMPHLSGWALEQTLRRDAQLRATPVVLVTGDPLLTYTAPGVLGRPDSPERLHALIANGCARRRRRR